MRIKALSASLVALSMAACVGPTDSNVSILQGPPVTEIYTPYTRALICLREQMTAQDIAPAYMAVGQIADRTGRSKFMEGETINVSEGAGDMVSSAIMANGIAYLVERLDTRIIAFEQEQAMKRILGDGKTSTIRGADGAKRSVAYRPVAIGSLQGSEYHLIGSITALDFAVSSAGGDVSVAGVGPRARQGRGLVALDLRVVETATGRVIAAQALNKQLVAEEIGAGIGRFFGTTLVNLDIGGNRSTPMGIMLRSMLNLAVFEVMADVYAVDTTPCRTELDKTEGLSPAAG